MSRFLAQNVNLLLFSCGFAVLYLGVSTLSQSVANIVAGVLLMGIAAWPYLMAGKR